VAGGAVGAVEEAGDVLAVVALVAGEDVAGDDVDPVAAAAWAAAGISAATKSPMASPDSVRRVTRLFVKCDTVFSP
jgi:hypothetical protein